MKYLQVYERPIMRDEIYSYNRVLEGLGRIELIQDSQDKRRRLIRIPNTQTEL